jgi:peptidyl-tRNA hydrolase
MIKQAIIVNLKANMSLGRLVAQVAHASELAREAVFFSDEFEAELKGWGDEHLLELHNKAKANGLPTAIMEEDGFVTACAIGPAAKKAVDNITFGMLLL